MSIREVWTELWKPKPRQNMTFMGGQISMQTIPNAMQGLAEAPEGIWEHPLKVHLHRFFSPFQAQKTRVSYGYQNEITLFPRQLENLIQTAPKLTVLGRA